MALPMLADFAIRMAGGLAGWLLATPWRVVPPAFFRTHCQVMLGLLALAAMVLGRGLPAYVLPATIAAAVLAFLASVAWGLGLPRLGIPLTAAIALIAAALLVWASSGPSAEVWALGAAGRLASAALLGATSTAMLLGHHYLTAPAMSIDPLRRFVRGIAVALAVRAALAAWGLDLAFLRLALPIGTEAHAGLFLAIRWGMGLLGPAIATVLAWKTVAIRSTQSATGILYAELALVLFGELCSMILSGSPGAIY
ncbi:MAG: hypothetical protein IRY99_08105 [Isosphaeraceae bacterium]|nr:hypothetical protein [Isosphaeraceae bacterium]